MQARRQVNRNANICQDAFRYRFQRQHRRVMAQHGTTKVSQLTDACDVVTQTVPVRSMCSTRGDQLPKVAGEAHLRGTILDRINRKLAASELRRVLLFDHPGGDAAAVCDCVAEASRPKQCLHRLFRTLCLTRPNV